MAGTPAASGLAAPPGQPGGGLAAWPPPGAVPVDVTGLYQELAAAGYEYGPAFRGLRAAWRRGQEVFAEAALPGDAADQAGSFGVHPALLDAVLHAAIAGGARAGDGAGPGQVLLPFAWAGLQVHAAGPAALRARLSPAPGGGISLAAADGTGAPAVTAASLVSRPVAAARLNAVDGAGCSACSGSRSRPAAAAGGAGARRRCWPGARAARGTGTRQRRRRAEAGRVLGLVQQWLAAERRTPRGW